MTKQIYRIALVGGPCAGKTTAFSYLSEKLNALGYAVYCVPESARLILGSGISHIDFSDNSFSLQSALLRSQRASEDVYNILAHGSNHDKVIILYDRGAMDIKAFTPPATWTAMLHELNFTEVDLRDYPYNAVIHMVTAAIGAEHAYVNDDVRKETPQRARELDQLILDAWTGHLHLLIIPNDSDGLDGKLRRTFSAVLRVVGHPIPMEIERKYLVRSVDFGKMPKTEVVNIEQHYLIQEGQRLRKRGQNGRFVYTLTEKRPMNGTLERMETERQLSPREYNNLMEYQDPICLPITKKRHCFVYNDQYFELDVFEGELGGLMVLEIELGTKEQPVYLPPWIKIEREVTDNVEYTNRVLSERRV